MHPLEFVIQTKFGARTVTGYWAVEAKKGGDRLKDVIADVESIIEAKMERKKVNNEIAVFRLAVALKAYDDCNPDVGMGYAIGHFVSEAAKQLNLRPEDYSKEHVLDLIAANR